VSAVSTMNNHSDDLGSDGYAFTHSVLMDKGLSVIGDRSTTSGVGVYQREDSDIPVAYVSFDTVSHAPVFIDTVKELSAKYRVIALPHWGKEYEKSHEEVQKMIAHDLIDAGADLIVGSHPHVIQDVEVYKGVPIFYSVGNFLFDQDFSEEVQQGLVVGGIFTDEALEIYLVPMQTYVKPYPLSSKGSGDSFKMILEGLSPYRAGKKDVYVFPIQ
jgi:Bacterial capsule synthesis protein PGA_cap